MTRLPFVAAFLSFAFFAGCDSGSSTASNGGTPGAGAKVDTAVIGTWFGIAGTSSDWDLVVITPDSLVSTWTNSDGSVTHAWSLYPVKFSGAWFYAKAGTGGAAGRMGITNGQTVSENVTYEYTLSHDTLWLELQGSTNYDGVVDRTSASTHAVVKVP